MRLALKDVGIAPKDVGYINAHGTSTEYNDANETQALKPLWRVCGKITDQLTKSMTGHLLGAAGAVEGVWSVRRSSTADSADNQLRKSRPAMRSRLCAQLMRES